MQSIFVVQDDGLTLNIYVQPGSGKDQFAGIYLDRLKIKVRSKPTDGAANESVCQFVAEYFGVSKSAVQIVRGRTSREKTLKIRGNPVQLHTLAMKSLD